MRPQLNGGTLGAQEASLTAGQLKADTDGLLRYRDRTYEFVICSPSDGTYLELVDVTDDIPCTLLIGRRLEHGQLELLSLENVGQPAAAPRFLPIELVDFFVSQLKSALEARSL